MKKLLRYPLLLIFVLFIFGVSIADVFATGKAYSETENRALKQRPAFSLPALVKNEYTKNYETFVCDQFVARDSWISLKSLAEKALGKQENNGVAFGADGYLIPRLYPEALVETRDSGTGFGGDGSQNADLETVSSAQIGRNIEFIRRFAESYDGQVSLALIPNAYEILPEVLPAGFVNEPQADRIRQINAALYEEAGVLPFDAYAPLLQSAQERQTFYRTDHHWTTDGAWAFYAAWAQSRGLDYAGPDELAPYRREEQNFLGTSYSKAKNFDVVPDTLVWYDIPVADVTINGEHTVTDSLGQTLEVTGLYQREKFATRDKYAAFLYGNNGLTVIKSAVRGEPAGEKPSRLLLIKDSYGNCLAPFLTFSYDEVWVVDLRALPIKMSELTAQTAFDDVLILYNFTSFGQDKDLARLPL